MSGFFENYGFLIVTIVQQALLGLSIYFPLMAGQLSLASIGFYSLGGYVAAVMGTHPALAPLREALGFWMFPLEWLGALVLSVALNVVGNRQDAEDICQETFFQVFSRLDRYDRARSFKTWLLTIAYRRSLDMLRKKRRFSALAARARYEPAAGPLATDPGQADPAPLPSKLLGTLSPRERTALTLWANEGCEIGRAHV